MPRVLSGLLPEGRGCLAWCHRSSELPQPFYKSCFKHVFSDRFSRRIECNLKYFFPYVCVHMLMWRPENGCGGCFPPSYLMASQNCAQSPGCVARTSPGDLSHCLCFSKNFLQMTPRNTVSLHYSETDDSDSGLIWIFFLRPTCWQCGQLLEGCAVGTGSVTPTAVSWNTCAYMV